jgi:hypothetical protein
MKQPLRILNVHAPSPRPTVFAAFCMALLMSCPFALVSLVLEWLW